MDLLGAGDGMITSKMAVYFKEIYVTEVSAPMIWRLDSLGYKYVKAYYIYSYFLKFNFYYINSLRQLC